MSFTGSVHIDGLKPASFILAGGDAAAPYLAVALNTSTSNTVQVADDETNFIGITQDTTPLKNGEHIAVKSAGFTLATVGADPIAIGDYVTVGADGTIIPATTTAIGQSLNGGDTGEYVEIRLFGAIVTL